MFHNSHYFLERTSLVNRFLALLAFASFVSFVPGQASAASHMMGMKHHHHHKQCRDAKGKFMKCPKGKMSM